MTESILQVSVGVIVNSSNEVLISKRPKNVHQPDLWEFPGGKVGANESTDTALLRELKEELGLSVISKKLLMVINFDYGDKKVCLNVYLIKEYSGVEKGLEGQPIKWVKISDLQQYKFPLANTSIINRLQLPDFIQITGNYSSINELLEKTQHCIDKGIRYLHFRAHEINDELYIDHAMALKKLCQKNNIKFIVNRTLDIFNKIDADGLHFSRYEMQKYYKRPCSQRKFFSVSCHNEDELRHAQNLSADYCFLSPVKPAISHKSGVLLGWEKFTTLTLKSNIPVYALGGISDDDIWIAKEAGGQGIAAISAYWA